MIKNLIDYFPLHAETLKKNIVKWFNSWSNKLQTVKSA